MARSFSLARLDGEVFGTHAHWLESDDLLVTATDVARDTLPVRSDRDRLLDATTTLIMAIEAIRPAREMQGLRGELNVLQREAEHMPQVVDQQSVFGRPAEVSF